MPLKLLMSTGLALLWLGPAVAQTPFKLETAAAPAAEPAAPRNSTGVAGLQIRRATPEPAQPQLPAAKVVDESALRFYASQGDTARVAAEVRRLKTLNPAWQPPQNLFDVAGPAIDEQPLWNLLAEKRFEALREEIARIQSHQPAYVPSSDLSTKLVQAEQRQRLVAAGDSQDWHLVIDVASESQDLLTCREIDVLWRVAEAFSAIGDAPRAADVYRYILAQCENPKERLATVQKASMTLPAASLQELIAMGRRRGSSGEFDPVLLDLIRRGVGKAAGGDRSELPGDREIKQLEASGRRGHADDAALLGWYAFARKDYAAAKDWFTLATKTPGQTKAIEGLILALRNGGHIEQAETLAYQYREADPLIRKQFIEIVASDITGPSAKALTPERQAHLEAFTMRDSSALGAQSLGWSLYNSGRLEPARGWFERAVSWGGGEDAVVGLIVAMHRTGQRAGAVALVGRYKEQFPAVASLARLQANPHGQGSGRLIAGRSRGEGGPSGVVRESIKLYESGRYREAAAILDRHQSSLPSGMQELRAWAHYNAADHRAARKIFTELKQKRPSKSIEHGEFLTEIQERGHPHRWWYN